MINKPKINREKALCADRERRHAQHQFEEICALLNVGEQLAEPFRVADRIVIPISIQKNEQDDAQH